LLVKKLATTSCFIIKKLFLLANKKIKLKEKKSLFAPSNIIKIIKNPRFNDIFPI
jgi:hypothetical protein